MFDEFKPAEVKGYGTKNVVIPNDLLRRLYVATTGKKLVGTTFDEAFEKESMVGGDVPVYRKLNAQHAAAKAKHVQAQKKLVHRITHEAKADNLELRRTLIVELIAHEMLRNFHTQCISYNSKTIQNIVHSKNLARNPNYDAVVVRQDSAGRKSVQIDYSILPVENRIFAFEELAKALEDRVVASKAAVEPEKELDDMVRKNPDLSMSQLKARYKNYQKYQDLLDAANAVFRASTKRIKVANAAILKQLKISSNSPALTQVVVQGYDPALPRAERKSLNPNILTKRDSGSRAKAPIKIKIGNLKKR